MDTQSRMTESERINELLRSAKTIAVVGLSDNPLRVSYDVSYYMQSQGYRILPVNPMIVEALGEKAYPTLSDVREKICLLYTSDAADE